MDAIGIEVAYNFCLFGVSSIVIGILLQPTAWYNQVKKHQSLAVNAWTSDKISMSISVDSPSSIWSIVKGY